MAAAAAARASVSAQPPRIIAELKRVRNLLMLVRDGTWPGETGGPEPANDALVAAIARPWRLDVRVNTTGLIPSLLASALPSADSASGDTTRKSLSEGIAASTRRLTSRVSTLMQVMQGVRGLALPIAGASVSGEYVPMLLPWGTNQVPAAGGSATDAERARSLALAIPLNSRDLVDVSQETQLVLQVPSASVAVVDDNVPGLYSPPQDGGGSRVAPSPVGHIMTIHMRLIELFLGTNPSTIRYVSCQNGSYGAM